MTDQRRRQEPFRGKDRRVERFEYPPLVMGGLQHRCASYVARCDCANLQADEEAQRFTDRQLAEAIYILLRRNELAQQNAADHAHTAREF